MRIANALVIVVLATSPLSANTTYFLPGDAFFYVRLGEQETTQLQNVASPVFHYGARSNGAGGCGYIGYEKIELSNMSDSTKTALLDAYRRFETIIGDDHELHGKMSVFIYSKKYDWKKYGIAIQYNENWADESLAFGTIREVTDLGSFSSVSNIRNWRDSNLVSALPAQCPEIPDGHFNDFPNTWSKTPVTIESDECCLLVIPNRDFDSYAILPSYGLELIEIVGGKLTYYQRDNGKWHPKD